MTITLLVLSGKKNLPNTGWCLDFKFLWLKSAHSFLEEKSDATPVDADGLNV